ncbi:MAG: glycosyltransferase [Opitutales bacterium]|jgi:glycosyltransferase involved in cell wall biosynthesis|nr:glycosyltransferase [Opitutales bacterium]MDP4694297.1 glycosyltransferase [Opitutales bacterium]MDP4879652.1 glycosyltransferase [Opitutales bacterium]MDP4883825.1 glycosyltransferase [Opitutales bacterium]
MSIPTPDYSIVIPAYNEAEELPATLAAIKVAMDAQPELGECIVVDNNSSDQTAAVATKVGFVKVVFEPENQIARARNTGVRASQAPYLVFIDADTRIKPELLSESLRRLQSGTAVGGGSVIRFEGPISLIGRFGIGIWERVSKLTRTAAGSYLYCRRDAFEAVGGFDQKLYASEEVRLSRLLRKWGKAQQLKFDILTIAPAQTSARKLNWHSGPKILGWVLLMMLLPIAVRSRKLCGFWYKRPALVAD